MKIGIFGGTFDPPTKAHQAVAKLAINAASLDKLFVVPTHKNPLKKRILTTSDSQRLAMCEIAFSGIPACEINDSEIVRDGPSYTIDTVKKIQSENEGEFWLIIGGDIIPMLPRWRNVKELLSLVKILVSPRLGTEYTTTIEQDIEKLPEWMCERIAIMGSGTTGSSTLVRNNFYKEDFVHDNILDPRVKDYILELGLYK